MPRKTIDVETLIDWVNTRLASPNSMLTVQDLTPEQAMRVGAYSLLEQILHATGNYEGFNYNDSEKSSNYETTGTGAWLKLGYDDTRRHYFKSKHVRG